MEFITLANNSPDSPFRASTSRYVIFNPTLLTGITVSVLRLTHSDTRLA